METIVYAYVVGDIIHVGHLIHLENAKALGDKLVVGSPLEYAPEVESAKPFLRPALHGSLPAIRREFKTK